MGNCPPEISKMIKIIYLGGKIIMVDFKFKKSGLFAAGVLFGTAGIKILTSKDAKKLYTGCTAAVLRAKDCHGAMCVSYSGRCLLSNYMTGRDSNRYKPSGERGGYLR